MLFTMYTYNELVDVADFDLTKDRLLETFTPEEEQLEGKTLEEFLDSMEIDDTLDGIRGDCFIIREE